MRPPREPRLTSVGQCACAGCGSVAVASSLGQDCDPRSCDGPAARPLLLPWRVPSRPLRPRRRRGSCRSPRARRTRVRSTAGGAVRCWGADRFGQARAPAGSFTAVAAGRGALRVRCGRTGAAVCWGADRAGQAQPAGDALHGARGRRRPDLRRARPAGRSSAGGAAWRGAPAPRGRGFRQVASAPSTRARCAAGGRVTLLGRARRGRRGRPPGRFARAGGRRLAHVRADRARVPCAAGARRSPGSARVRAGRWAGVSVGRAHACVVSRGRPRALLGRAGGGRARAPAVRAAPRSPRASAHTLRRPARRRRSTCWGAERLGPGDRSRARASPTSPRAASTPARCAAARRSAGARARPGQARPPAGGASPQISAGSAHTCALTTSRARSTLLGVGHASGSRARRAARSPRSARAATTRARCRSAVPPSAGAPRAAARRRRRPRTTCRSAAGGQHTLRPDVRRARAVLGLQRLLPAEPARRRATRAWPRAACTRARSRRRAPRSAGATAARGRRGRRRARSRAIAAGNLHSCALDARRARRAAGAWTTTGSRRRRPGASRALGARRLRVVRRERRPARSAAGATGPVVLSPAD